ncbi:MAG: C39 family peptidase [Clostridia bacterium]|nr:C39 family peptidase [Clostridia bacterium]
MTDMSSKRIVSLILSILLCFSALSGCDMGFDSCAPAPELTLIGTYPYQLPRLDGFDGAEELTKRLCAHYGALDAPLRDINSGGTLAYASYELTENGGQYTLCSYISGVDSGSIPIDEIHINLEGDTRIDPIELGLFDDTKFLSSYFELERIGLDVDIGRRDDTLSELGLYEGFIQYYETIASETDVFRISEAVSGSDTLLKSLELGLTETTNAEYLSQSVSYVSLLDAAAAIMERATADVCANSSVPAIAADAFAYCSLFLDIADFISIFNDSALFDKWNGCKAYIKAAYTPEQAYNPATRNSIAEMLVRLYEAAYGSIDDSFYDYEVFTDTSSEAAIKAYAADLMFSFPTSSIFSPEYTLHQYELPELAEDFAETCMREFLSENAPLADASVTYGGLIKTIAAMHRHIGSETAYTIERTDVCNDRDYDWYLTQYDNSYYADVNCMPTISAMAIRWYTGNLGITQHELRQKFLPDYTSGWWMWQVEECLTDYGVPFESRDISLDSMLADLDNGCIILAQMSEVDLSSSGHCFIIYGYHQNGSSIVFDVHDPGVSYGTNIYNEPPGKAMRIDSAYAFWTIDRFAYNYLAVGTSQTQ